MADIAVRQACPDDLDRLAGYEVEIARVSFGDDAVTDERVHRHRLARALATGPDGMLVAVDPAGTVVGWAWFAAKQNFVTGQPVANFRSFASSVPEATGPLFEAGLAWARDRGLREITGHVHVGNAAMRLLYRGYGFTPVALTLRRRLP